MTGKTGHLWALIQEWIDAQPYPPSQRKLAARIGVGHSTITDWKYARTLPAVDDLKALATEIGVPYERVLNATLIDHGYRDESAPPMPPAPRKPNKKVG